MDISIERLKILERMLPLILNDNSVKWKTLDVDYHPPRVERLWNEYGDIRIYLHVIHPCDREAALFHPHPWPSAIKILSGSYEMGVGYGPGSGLIPPKETAKLILPVGTYYEMLEVDGWHYVRPLEEVMSVMITGPKWGREEIKSNKPLQPLSSYRADEILNRFKQHYTI